MPTDLLPVHPFTGLAALGFRRNGAPIWPILGGSEDAGEPDETEDEQPDDADDEPDEDDTDKPLGPAGEKALQAEKDKRRTEAARRRAAEKRATELEAELAKARRGQAKDAKPADKQADADDAPDPEEIRRQAREEAHAEVMRERVLDKIEAKAAKGFADPEDAVALVMRGRDAEDFLDGGKVDIEAINEALAELLESKPYLAVPAQGDGKRFKGSGDGGAKPNKPTRPKSLSEAVTNRLRPS